jgi:hypothetical protein
MGTYSVVAHYGKMYGPVNETALIDWIHQGRVIRDTVLHCHETNTQSPAWRLPELQQPLGLSPQEVNQLLHPTIAPTGPAPAAHAPIAYATPPMFYGGPPSPQVSHFPVIGAVLLSMFVPLFAPIYYGIMHGSLPKRRPDDPGAGKAIGFMFIPLFNIFWVCFFWIRLCTRLNDELTRVGLAPTAPRSLAIAICWCYIGLIIPFVNILAGFAIAIMAVIALVQIQSSANALAAATQRA